MAGEGLLVGEVARHRGASRKALRLYEAAGILPSPRRTASGYRVYDADALGVLAFVSQAQRLGFTLEEIKEIASIQRSGRLPCPHVHDLVARKRTDLDRRLADLSEMRKRLDAVLRRWRSRCDTAAMCLHIEQSYAQPRPYENGRNEEGGPHDPSCLLGADAGRRCRGVRSDRGRHP